MLEGKFCFCTVHFLTIQFTGFHNVLFKKWKGKKKKHTFEGTYVCHSIAVRTAQRYTIQKYNHSLPHYLINPLNCNTSPNSQELVRNRLNVFTTENVLRMAVVWQKLVHTKITLE